MSVLSKTSLMFIIISSLFLGYYVFRATAIILDLCFSRQMGFSAVFYLFFNQSEDAKIKRRFYLSQMTKAFWSFSVFIIFIVLHLLFETSM